MLTQVRFRPFHSDSFPCFNHFNNSPSWVVFWLPQTIIIDHIILGMIWLSSNGWAFLSREVISGVTQNRVWHWSSTQDGTLLTSGAWTHPSHGLGPDQCWLCYNKIISKVPSQGIKEPQDHTAPETWGGRELMNTGRGRSHYLGIWYLRTWGGTRGLEEWTYWNRELTFHVTAKSCL